MASGLDMENVFIKKDREKRASCCDSCKRPLVWLDKRLICPVTTCKLYGKFQMIKRPPAGYEGDK